MSSQHPPEAVDIGYTTNFDDLTQPFHPPRLEFAAFEGEEREKYREVDIPESLNHRLELTEGQALVYSQVRSRHLAEIAVHGLLKRKNTVGTMASPVQEAAFFAERPSSLARFDRTRSLFAIPHAPWPEHASYRDSHKGHLTYLQLLVEAKEVLVTDQQLWDEAFALCKIVGAASVSRPKVASLIKPFARWYWDGALPLADYLAAPPPEIRIPEVIIPFDIPPGQIAALK